MPFSFPTDFTIPCSLSRKFDSKNLFHLDPFHYFHLLLLLEARKNLFFLLSTVLLYPLRHDSVHPRVEKDCPILGRSCKMRNKLINQDSWHSHWSSLICNVYGRICLWKKYVGLLWEPKAGSKNFESLHCFLPPSMFI